MSVYLAAWYPAFAVMGGIVALYGLTSSRMGLFATAVAGIVCVLPPEAIWAPLLP